MSEWVDFISSVGFPIAVTVFVLVKLQTSMKRVEDALIRMTEAIIRIEALHAK